MLTLVPWMRNPCTTSALTPRNVTGVSAGTRMQFGENAYCCASSRTVIAPLAAADVPRLPSENSPPSCSRVESIVSTLEGGLSLQCIALNTTTATSATMIAAIDQAHTISARWAVRSAWPSSSARDGAISAN